MIWQETEFDYRKANTSKHVEPFRYNSAARLQPFPRQMPTKVLELPRLSPRDKTTALFQAPSSAASKQAFAMQHFASGGSPLH